jgi:hypothetical protein
MRATVLLPKYRNFLMRDFEQGWGPCPGRGRTAAIYAARLQLWIQKRRFECAFAVSVIAPVATETRIAPAHGESGVVEEVDEKSKIV